MNNKDTRPLIALWLIVMILIRSQIASATLPSNASDAPVSNTAQASREFVKQ